MGVIELGGDLVVVAGVDCGIQTRAFVGSDVAGADVEHEIDQSVEFMLVERQAIDQFAHMAFRLRKVLRQESHCLRMGDLVADRQAVFGQYQVADPDGRITGDVAIYCVAYALFLDERVLECFTGLQQRSGHSLVGGDLWRLVDGGARCRRFRTGDAGQLRTGKRGKADRSCC